MKYYLLIDDCVSQETAQRWLDERTGSLFVHSSHLSEEREECQEMLDDPETYGSDGQHIVEIESSMDHDSLSCHIFG